MKKRTLSAGMITLSFGALGGFVIALVIGWVIPWEPEIIEVFIEPQEVIEEPVLIEPGISVEGYVCLRRGDLVAHVEDYEVTLTVVCPMDILNAYYIAEVPGA